MGKIEHGVKDRADQVRVAWHGEATVMRHGCSNLVQGSSWCRVATLGEAWLMAWHSEEEADDRLEAEAQHHNMVSWS